MRERGATLLALATVPSLALLYIPGLSSPFLAPKAFLLAVVAATLLVMAPATPWEGQRSLAIAITAFIGWQVFAAGVSEYREITPPILVFVVCGPMLMWLAGPIVRANFAQWQRWIVITACALSVGLTLQAVSADHRGEIAATLGNPLFVGVFLAPCLVLAVMQARVSRRSVAAAVVILFGLLVTGSRTGVVAATVGLVFLGASRWRMKQWMVVAAAALVVVIWISKANPRTFREAWQGRAFVTRVSVQNPTLSLREGWGAHPHQSFRQIALGSGPGTFASTYPEKLSAYFANGAHADEYRFAGYERHAHNEWVELFVEAGALGVLTLAAVFVVWFMRVRREGMDEIGRACTAAVVTLLLASFADFPFHRAETWALLWVTMGASVGRPQSAISERQNLIGAVARVGMALALVAVAVGTLVSSRHIYVGAQFEGSGRAADAETHYRAALRYQPGSQDAHFNLVRVICKQGRYAECVGQSKIAEKYVDEGELYVLRARALADLGFGEAARAELDSARRRFPWAKL